MNRSWRLLEYPVVLERLAAEADTVWGQELALELEPAVSLSAVEERLHRTAEARALQAEDPGAGLGRVFDLRAGLRRLLQGAALDGPTLWGVAETLGEATRWRELLVARATTRPLLAAWALDLAVPGHLEPALRRAITPDGEVADGASPALRRLRQEKVVLAVRIRETLEEMQRSTDLRQYLQEAPVTVRDDRYVLPVKRQYRARIPGLLHDTSQSGATVFIEPMKVVNLGNRLREVLGREREEVERILAELSGLVAAQVETVGQAAATLAGLDLVLAQARLSAAWDGRPVALNERGVLHLEAARHPLLGERAVPIDLRLGEDFTGLVVSGPNTGGKTVALKTAGLISLLVLSGLEPPVGPGSQVAVFRRILVDLGDEQNLPESLSTFSARIRAWREILESADREALVLIDELGTGTSPREGSALAIAILEELARRGVRVLVTSHLGELKEFAQRHPDFQNASVEFDSVAFRPTYRFVTGWPGNSYALPTARRLGLSAQVLGRAEEILGKEQTTAGEILLELEETRRELSIERERAARERSAAREAAEGWKVRLEGWEAEHQRLREKARAEAEELVRSARQKVEEALYLARHAREATEEEARHQAFLAREALREAREGLGETMVPSGPTPEGLRVGEPVRLRRLGQEGTVLAVSPDGQVEVQVGAWRLQVTGGELERGGSKTRPAENWTGIGLAKRQAVRPEVHLRGLSVEEALEQLEKYLDDAQLADLDQVRIIHGKGGGVLRRAVAEYLGSRADIESHRLGENGEGGDGATVAYFRGHR